MDELIGLMQDVLNELIALRKEIKEMRGVGGIQPSNIVRAQNSVVPVQMTAPFTEVKDNIIQEGMYKVGLDIQAGEYAFFPVGANKDNAPSISVYNQDNGRDLADYKKATGRIYMTLELGQLLEIEHYPAIMVRQ